MWIIYAVAHEKKSQRTFSLIIFKLISQTLLSPIHTIERLKSILHLACIFEIERHWSRSTVYTSNALDSAFIIINLQRARKKIVVHRK